MSEELAVDRQHQTDDPDDTTVRPALSDDLLEPAPYSDDDDLLADEEFMAPGGPRPSRLTRVLLVLLILGLGILVGVQLSKVAGASSAGSATGGSGQSRRFGQAGAGAGTAGVRPSTGSFNPGGSVPAAQGEVSSVKAHTLVLKESGVTRTVTFTDATPVTQPYGHAKLAVGDVVSVTGSRAADGSVNATAITVR